MKKSMFVTILLLVMGNTVFAQTTEAESTLKKVSDDIPDGWSNGGLFSLSFTQVSLTNWAAGGQNSVSGAGLVSLFSNYRKESFTWNNTLDLGYGLMKQGEDGVMKTDDKFDVLSKAGMKAGGEWYYAGLVNLKTQMTPGYSYPNDSVAISRFLSPGYILGALGMDYKPNDNFSLFIAPLTSKITIVNDQTLADEGAFGVEPGKKSRGEFGGYLRTAFKANLAENISFQTKADFFSNYLDNPQQIDVNWENLVMVKLGRFFTISFATHLIYDADILFDTNDDGVADSSKVQFKQLLGVGVSYNL